MSRLSSKAMLAELTIRKWGASKSDKMASDDLAMSKRSNPSMTRVTKTLMQSPHLIGFDQQAAAARNLHHSFTLPWLDNGLRILPVKKFLEYGRAIRDIKEQGNNCVNSFCDDYPNIIDKAKKSLGDLFKVTDYPDVRSLPDKFNISMRFFPLPNADDWRIQLSKEDVAILKDELRDSFVDSQNRAVDDLHAKVRDKLTKLEDILDDDPIRLKQRLRETHLSSLDELPEWITVMNVFDDARLTKLASKLKNELDFNFDADGIKADDSLRIRVLDGVRSVMKELPPAPAA
jgi:hypothetical protein